MGAEGTVVKDLRAKDSKSGLSVVICSRPGIPGHAMVILGREDEAKKACTVEAFGFYPESGTKALFGPVPGKIADEFLAGKGIAKAACRVILKVDKDKFDEVDAVRRRWASKKEYKLLEADCVTFAGEVARKLGLKVPKRGEAKTPMKYVEKLYEMNK
jgi:hypothetical protein